MAGTCVRRKSAGISPARGGTDCNHARFLKRRRVRRVENAPAGSVTTANGGVNIIRLCGPHPDLKFTAEEVEPAWVDALAPTRVAARFPEDAVIPVYPLLIPTDEPDSRTSIGLLDQAVMIDGVTDGKPEGA